LRKKNRVFEAKREELLVSLRETLEEVLDMHEGR